MQTQTMKPKVLAVIYNPIIEGAGYKKLTQLFGWYEPEELIKQYIADISEASGGFVQYEIAEKIEVDGYPVLGDGFTYDDESFVSCWRERSGFHKPEEVDYNAIIEKFKIMQKVEKGLIDEVWLFAFPYAGFWESTMAGKDAFYCNSDPVRDTQNCPRRFIIMGFNYERDVGCMLEDLGHRTESIMKYVFRDKFGKNDLWEAFSLFDAVAPGEANCGNVHFAPNSEKDYDWGNKRYVMSGCDDWYKFPFLTGARKEMNCQEWGDGNMRTHHLWWLKHIPRAAGETSGISNNWWIYIVDPNKVK